MQPLFSEVVSTFVQVFVFTLIPFVFFLFRKNKAISFARYIGLYKPPPKALLYVLLTALLFLITGIGLAFVNDTIRQAVLSPNSVTGKLRLMGLNTTTITILLLMAWFKTALAEEIFFRGFLAKQLIQKWGFRNGNLLQAALFGLIHLLLFWLLTQTTFLHLMFIFVFSSFAGWTIGYIKEKFAAGSIVPGWIAHGLGNTLSYFIIAFLM